MTTQDVRELQNRTSLLPRVACFHALLAADHTSAFQAFNKTNTSHPSIPLEEQVVWHHPGQNAGTNQRSTTTSLADPIPPKANANTWAPAS